MVITTSTQITTEEITALALEAGFSHAAPLEMSSLVFREDVRDMCAADKCRSYAKCWSCPPACGSLETITARAAAYDSGVIVQTTGPMEDDFDMAAIRDTAKEHKTRFDTLVRQMRMITGDCLPMGAGACTRCRKCTYPDRPCRHPDRLYPSMEAYGLWVSDVCIRSGLEYNYGPKTITYTSCILYKQEP